MELKTFLLLHQGNPDFGTMHDKLTRKKKPTTEILNP